MHQDHFKRKDCRQCNSKDLSIAIKLKPTPLANDYVNEKDLKIIKKKYPLDVYFCNSCKHLQLLDVVNPKTLFENYVYVSGTSSVFVKHFEKYAEYLNNNLRNKIYQNQDNPFRSEIFKKVESVDMRQEICGMDEPAIVLATSGMVNGGPVMEYLRHWAPESNNTMVFVGYQASGTTGQRLQQGADEIHLHDRAVALLHVIYF